MERVPSDAVKATFAPDAFGLRLASLTLVRDGAEVDVLHRALTTEQAAFLMEYLTLSEHMLALAASRSARTKKYPALFGTTGY